VKIISSLLGLGLVVLLSGFQCVTMAQEKGYSHVRIVRLSFVDGSVLVKRPDSSEWAKASVNTPIEEGFTVATSNGSYAEAQFENGSTARLGESSRLDFSQLALAPNGDKINHLVFDQGYGTFNFTPKHGDDYSVQAANATVTPRGKSEFRVDLGQNAVRVEVFDGSVKVDTPGRAVDLGKGKVLQFNTANEEALNVSRDIQEDAWDKWVHGRDQQTVLALNDSAVGMNSPVSGWSDLDQYGEWAFFPGYGYGWSPFEPMGWSPFSMGQWSSYSGFGPTWISAEPWGWLPYHYGFWSYDPTFGYFWMPGAGGFNTFYPGLVNWYSGAGYIGWSPVGVGGKPLCTQASCIVAVRPTVLERGELISTGTRVSVGADQVLRPVSSPNIVAGELARLSGTPVTQGFQVSETPREEISGRTAPKILFMGQTATEGAREMEALTAHKSLFGRAFTSEKAQTVQARLGNTLGGRYAIAQSGGLRPMNIGSGTQARYEGGQVMRSPMLLPHASALGDSRPVARMDAGGDIRASSGESSGAHGGDGFGGSPGTSAGSSSSAGMAGASHGAAVSSGGGGHGH
jgi:FecR protein